MDTLFASEARKTLTALLVKSLSDLYRQADIMPCPHPVCTPENCAIVRAEKLLRTLGHLDD